MSRANPRKYYYQGSYQSTDSGIEEAFRKAQAKEKTLNVLFFDEIGMAELNSKNPLKVLHKLLDQNIRGEEAHEEAPGRVRFFDKKNFSFISISNWKLDLSKMSRSVYITRPDLAQEDLEVTAKDLMMNSFESHLEASAQERERDTHLRDIQEKVDSQSTQISQGYLFLRRNQNDLVVSKKG